MIIVDAKGSYGWDDFLKEYHADCEPLCNVCRDECFLDGRDGPVECYRCEDAAYERLAAFKAWKRKRKAVP